MYEHLQVNPHCWQRHYFIFYFIFFFRAETYSSIQMYHIFVHEFIQGPSSCFHLSVTASPAAVNFGMQVSFWIRVFLDNHVGVFSVFKNLHTVLPGLEVLLPTFIPLKRVGGCFSTHALPSRHYLGSAVWWQTLWLIQVVSRGCFDFNSQDERCGHPFLFFSKSQTEEKTNIPCSLN